MFNSPLIRRAIALLALFFMIGADVVARAEKPFMYYPAYGSSRGHIRYVDGLLRNKQKIHWGNGVTDNGVLVMRDLAAAAQVIVPKVVHGADTPQDDAQKTHGLPEAIDGKTDAQWQSQADSIRAQNRALLAALNGGKIDVGKVTDPTKPPVSGDESGLRLLVVYNDELNTQPDQLDVINSTMIKNELKKLGGGFRSYPDNNESPRATLVKASDEEWGKMYDEAVKSSENKRPFLVFWKAGKILGSQPLNSGEGQEKVLELVKMKAMDQ